MYKVEKIQTELEELDKKQSQDDANYVCSIAEDADHLHGERGELIEKLDVALRELGE
jgi:hypothetical protein